MNLLFLFFNHLITVFDRIEFDLSFDLDGSIT